MLILQSIKSSMCTVTFHFAFIKCSITRIYSNIDQGLLTKVYWEEIKERKKRLRKKI